MREINVYILYLILESNLYLIIYPILYRTLSLSLHPIPSLTFYLIYSLNIKD